MPLLAPKSSVNAATAYSFDATSQSYIQPAEIEMLVSDEDEYGVPRDSRASHFFTTSAVLSCRTHCNGNSSCCCCTCGYNT